MPITAITRSGDENLDEIQAETRRYAAGALVGFPSEKDFI
jgi:hypothetical protein